MGKYIFSLWLGLMSGCMGLIVPSFAQLDVCDSDRQKFCPDAKAETEQIACLQQQAQVISVLCRTRLRARQAQEQVQLDPCQYDVTKFCPEVQSTLEQVACLRQHEVELSASCQGLLLRRRSRALGDLWPCKGDINRLCGGIELHSPDLLYCLQAHRNELSLSCQDAFSKPG